MSSPASSAAARRSSVVIAVEDTSGVGEARRAAAALAAQCGLDAETAGRVALVVSEAATNLVKHAERGEIVLRAIEQRERAGIEVLSVDAGPGLDVVACMRDGYSSAGSRGVGLGAIERAATTFDLSSSPETGTILLARVLRDVKPGAVSAPEPAGLGAICVPHPHETVCGDAWLARRDHDVVVIAGVDGLGHGPAAADASAVFLATVERELTEAPAEILARAHAAMRSTRGAAAAVARLDLRAGQLVYAGIGNLAADVIPPEGRAQSCVSQHGIVGTQARRVHETTYAFPEGSLFVMCSDGITSSWRLDRHPGLVARHPAVVAGAIWRLHRRGRDDATVVVWREVGAGEVRT